MELIKKISFVLTIIGGLNWGLIGLLGIDFVSMLFGPMTILARLVYVLTRTHLINRKNIFPD